jgi:proteasome lid subunit RPN8/RPN11
MIKWFIYKDVLESIMEFSKSFYPNEFSGMLFSRNNIIEEIYIIPQTKSNQNSAVIRLDFVPLSLSINGSVHSHPSGDGSPSRADLSFFQTKDINIIAFYPFSLSSFKAYDSGGKRVEINVILREKSINLKNL